MSNQDRHICGGFGALEERARELECLHVIDDLLRNPDAPLGNVLRDVMCAIPSGWCDPQACRARMTIESQTFHMAGFQESHRVHSAGISLQSRCVGALEICCAREVPCAKEDPLRKAKGRLVDAVARRIEDFLAMQYLLRLSRTSSLPDDPDIIVGDLTPTEQGAAPPFAETEFPGLCTTCVYSATCAFPRLKGQAVLSCEEFDDHGKGPAEHADPPPPAVEVSQAPASPVKDESSAYKGLCSSCANRETCTFPRPPGGVWHCEEFS